MQLADFDREIMRLRNHFGERHYSSELAKIFWNDFGHMDLGSFRKIVLESIATHSQGKPPLRDDFKEIGKRLQVKSAPSWKYFEVDDCMTCGGVGWHYACRPDGAEGIVACDDCRAGKNMQIAPRPHIAHTLKQTEAVYSRPGRGRK